MRYLKPLATRATPQSLPLPGSAQAPNSAGGYAWAVDDWTRLDRFLVLGSEGGSYYATEPALTRENARAVARCLAADGPRAVWRIVAVSEAGRAPKNDPALFALALAAAEGDDATRRAALAALPRVARTGTHLLHFAAFADGLRGWGRGLRRAVAGWYADRGDADLAYQLVKYQARDGWSHRDLLRLAHPRPATETRRALYYWATRGWPGVGEAPHPDEGLRLIWAFERAKRAVSAREVAALVRDHRLPREAVPTAWLTEAAVWEALLEGLPLGALLRNLATLTRVGLVAPGSDASRAVAARLGDREGLRRARIHPLAVLAALVTYGQGHGARGRHTWTPVAAVVEALDAAFYLAFGNVAPTGRHWLLALDVSGSMGAGVVAGVPGLTPRVAAAAMALVTANVEAEHTIVGFTSGGGWARNLNPADVSGLAPLAIDPRQRLDEVVRYTAGLPFGGTDCSLPMRWALKHRLAVDVFAVYTDSETWAGPVHPAAALREYRARVNPAARMVTVGLVSNGFTIADPDDAGMLDVVGFDTAAPALIADFAAAAPGVGDGAGG